MNIDYNEMRYNYNEITMFSLTPYVVISNVSLVKSLMSEVQMKPVYFNHFFAHENRSFTEYSLMKKNSAFPIRSL